MNPTPDGIFHFWLLLRWGLPLLALVPISYLFIFNYLHERAQAMGAIAKLANATEKSSLWEAPKAMPEAKTSAEQAGLRNEPRVSTGPGKATGSTNQGQPSGLTLSAPCHWRGAKGEPEAPATSVERWRPIDAPLFQKRSS